MFKLRLQYLVVAVLLILGNSKNSNAFRMGDIFGLDDDTEEDTDDSDYGVFDIFSSILNYFDDDSSEESDENQNEKTVLLCKNCKVTIITESNGNVAPQADSPPDKTSNTASQHTGGVDSSSKNPIEKPNNEGMSNVIDTNGPKAPGTESSLPQPKEPPGAEGDLNKENKDNKENSTEGSTEGTGGS